MWYVVQVRTGTEEQIRLQCEKKISDAGMEQCFIPCYEEKKKINGMWSVQKKILFPGYLFIVSGDLTRLHRELKGVIGLTKLLGTGDEIVPLKPEEIEFLRQFGGEDQVVEMSEGIIENDQVIVCSGPLKGMEGYIRRIDRHKRKAYLEIPMFGHIQKVQVGLEVVAKVNTESRQAGSAVG